MRILLLAFSIFLAIGLNGQKVSTLSVGDTAPLFEGKDQNEKLVSLSKSLEKSESTVLIFYRGSWCPYCEKHMAELQESLQEILDKGSSVIVVTPEKAESIEKMISKTEATFSIIHDEEYKIMDAYDLSFKIDKETVPRFYKFVLNATREANENEEDILPIPATYVIGKDGKIKFLHFDEDYRNRSSMEEIITNL